MSAGDEFDPDADSSFGDFDGPNWPAEPSIHFLIRAILRRSELCPGGPTACDRCETEHCLPGQRCSSCPLSKLDSAERGSDGMLLQRAIEVRNDLQMHVAVTLDEIDADVYALLPLIEREVQEWEKEKADRERNRR